MGFFSYDFTAGYLKIIFGFGVSLTKDDIRGYDYIPNVRDVRSRNANVFLWNPDMSCL